MSHVARKQIARITRHIASRYNILPQSGYVGADDNERVQRTLVGIKSFSFLLNYRACIFSKSVKWQ